MDKDDLWWKLTCFSCVVCGIYTLLGQWARLCLCMWGEWVA